eukprot:472164_1
MQTYIEIIHPQILVKRFFDLTFFKWKVTRKLSKEMSRKARESKMLFNKQLNNYNCLPIYKPQNILHQFEIRVDKISDNIAKIEQQLDQLAIDSTECIQHVNQRCDAVLQIIEDYRNSLLKMVEKLKTKKKQELTMKLKKFKNIYSIATNTNKKCHKYISNMSYYNKYSIQSYGLIYLNKLINEGYKQEQQLNNNNNNFQTSFKLKKTITINFKNLLQTQLPLQLHLNGIDIPLHNDQKFMVIIPTRIKHKIVLENWFRIHANKKIFSELPSDIMNLMNAFSAVSETDVFDPKLKTPKITLQNNSSIAKTNSFTYESVFGTIITNPGTVYKWKIKILNARGAYINIGIIELNKCNEHLTKSWWLTDYGYAYHSGDGNFYHKDVATFGGMKYYGDSYRRDDVIDIHLDLIRNTIAFGKNGTFYGDENVKGNTNYRLAIGLCNGAIQLLCSNI